MTFSCVIRNRAVEQKKYTLDLDEESLEVRDFNLSPRAVATMRHYNTVELPPAFVHAVEDAPRVKGVKYMKCEAFVLENVYPNNICLLTGNRVMFCIDFISQNQGARGENADKLFFLEGFIFRKIEPAFLEPESSAQIGFFRASNLDCGHVEKVTPVQLVSKCFIFPRGADPHLRPMPDIDPLPTSMGDTIKRYVLEQSDTEKEHLRRCIREESCRAPQSPDYWWVHSIAIPGRFPNVGQ